MIILHVVLLNRLDEPCELVDSYEGTEAAEVMTLATRRAHEACAGGMDGKDAAIYLDNGDGSISRRRCVVRRKWKPVPGSPFRPGTAGRKEAR